MCAFAGATTLRQVANEYSHQLVIGFANQCSALTLLNHKICSDQPGDVVRQSRSGNIELFLNIPNRRPLIPSLNQMSINIQSG